MKTAHVAWGGWLKLTLCLSILPIPVFAFTDADWVSLNSGGSGTVKSIVVDGIGNVYVGGDFTSIGGVAANNVAKWDGHGWSPLGSGAGAVNALALDGTNLYAAGYSVLKWNGTTWSALGSGMNGPVWALTMMGTNLYAGGNFTNAGGVAANCMAKWNGSAWSALGEGITVGFPSGPPPSYTIVGPWVQALAVQGTNLYAGGLFQHPSSCIARWDSIGWWSMPELGNSIGAIAVSGTNIYGGGYIKFGNPANKIAKFNGTDWSVLGLLSGGDNDGITALAFNETNLYAGGLFTTIGSASAANIAKWDGNSWSGLGSGVNGMVYAMAIDGAGHLFVGGAFTTAGTNFSAMIAQANIGSAAPTVGEGQVVVWGGAAPTNIPAGATNLIAVAAGGGHCMALKSDGTVLVWGNDAGDVTNVPPTVTNAVAIVTADNHALALRADGTVCAWGDNSYRQTDVPAGLTNVVAIAANYYGSLALKSDGTVVLWGYINTGLSAVESPAGLTNLVAISMGHGVWDCGSCFGLVLKEEGSVARLGFEISNCTARVPDFTNAVAVFDGSYHGLALKADGTVVAWGDGSDGKTNVPAGLSNVVAVAANDRQSFALKNDGTIVQWGWATNPPPANLSNVVSIAAATSFGVALLGDAPPVTQAESIKPVWSQGQFSCVVPSRSGRVYRLQYKNSLEDSAWMSTPLIAGTGGAVVLRDPNAGNAARFYRVQQW